MRSRTEGCITDRKDNSLRRPVSKLYPLEVRSTSISSDVDRRCDSQRGQLNVERPPKHKAAIDGELIRRLVNSEELKGSVMNWNPKIRETSPPDCYI